MAYGNTADLGGGVLAIPNDPQGYSDWASMTSMTPGHALVGGSAGSPGYGGGQRQVALAQQNATIGATGPGRGWGELFNLKGNPLGWVLMAVIGYWGLSHISFNKDRRR